MTKKITLIFCVISSILNCQSPSLPDAEIYEKYYQPYTTYETFKSKDANLEKQLNQGLELYLAEKYPESFDVFSMILESNFQKQITASFYSGLCLLEMQGTSPELREIVESLFLDIIRQGRNPFVRQAQWYLGLFYLKNLDGEKSIPVLKLLTEKEGEFYEEAKEILPLIKV